jgi:hypothetical protein
MPAVVQFGQRRKKPVEIDADLKIFLDEVVVPLLIRDAFKGFNDKRLASQTIDGPNSAQMYHQRNYAGPIR